jgi:ketosteroid isomerase-like protein
MILLLWPSCRQRTEADNVLETVNSLARLAEKKDVEAIMAHFAEDFSDFDGRDKSRLRSLLSSYFSDRMGIVVHRLSSRIIDLTSGNAALETEVALSSGGAEALRRLVRISPDIYRLRIDLAKVGEKWLIGYAEWASIGLTELLPESLGELRKIFPKIWVDR